MDISVRNSPRNTNSARSVQGKSEHTQTEGLGQKKASLLIFTIQSSWATAACSAVPEQIRHRKSSLFEEIIAVFSHDGLCETYVCLHTIVKYTMVLAGCMFAHAFLWFATVHI